ncbi:MAG: TIGR03663 family protein [Opitutaceae bacterium]|nr:TIGR03663 family protein [Opitutaceae bacterium]
MPPRLIRALTLATLLAAALWLRLHELGRRPMHADEANQAVKTGELLDAGRYVFDPRDHHGPTLYYAAAITALLRGETSLPALSETTVRFVPAVAGVLAVLFTALLGTSVPGRDPGRAARWPALAAATFVAVSPPALYYSRYFIQETLLAAFTLACLVAARSWWRSGLTRWAIAAGVAAGLMQATKASAPLFLVCAWLAARIAGLRPATRRPGRDLAAAAGAALLIAALLYSSFGTNLAGLRDALAAYLHAAERLLGPSAPPTGHEKPWDYYVRLFGWQREHGIVWHQAPFTALALAGMIVAFTRRDPVPRALSLYALFVAALFSALPYKTPWHTVHLVAPLALLAAVALGAISRLHTGRPVAAAFGLILTATLLQQAWRASFIRPADWRNPWAYVHSSADVRKVTVLATAARQAEPGRPIRVISEEYWPLPWYLRAVPDVGYWTEPPEDCDGALTIASNSLADTVRARLRRPHRESVLGLRPGFILIVFTPEP